MTATTERELSFGEKAVGLTFNPSNDANVQAIKESCAKVIDVLNDLREKEKEPKEDQSKEEALIAGERIRMLSVAITELQSGQMWGVKAVTWK